MFDIDIWSKDKVHSVMRELLFSLNYMWFLMEGWIKENCPEKMESESFLKLSDEFGAYEAKRLAKTVDPSLEGMDRLVKYIEHSHWCAFEDIELTRISDNRLRMRTLGCTAQKAARKFGMGHYACGKSGLRLRSGFCRQIDPSLQVERVFTPPDEKPQGTLEEVSCEWIISTG